MTEITNLLARFIEQLRGERSCADTGAVGLHDAIHIADLIGADTQTSAGTCTDGV